MDELLNQYAYQSRKSRSTIIEEALKQYMSGYVEDAYPACNDKISLMEERINILESKIRNLEKRENTPREGFKSTKEYGSYAIARIVTENSKKLNSVENSSPPAQENSDEQTTISLDPDGWYTQTLVGEFLDPSILLSTRKSIVSLAVARGEMETNGKKRKGCRIKGSSAIEWIKSMRRKEKPPIFFLGSS